MPLEVGAILAVLVMAIFLRNNIYTLLTGLMKIFGWMNKRFGTAGTAFLLMLLPPAVGLTLFSLIAQFADKRLSIQLTIGIMFTGLAVLAYRAVTKSSL